MSVFSGLVFDNRFTRELPADPDSSNRRRPVRGACYSRVKPTPVASPKLIGWSSDMAIRLGLPAIPGSHADELARVLGGNVVVDGMDPFAMCYGGHQFGNWAGQLGDGRAINLGEVKNAAGEYWTLQLKGAGPTPYSRTADGLAVLRSSVREFLCSEAMHWLGVPTTRALSLVTTGEQVVRDDGAGDGVLVLEQQPGLLEDALLAAGVDVHQHLAGGKDGCETVHLVTSGYDGGMPWHRFRGRMRGGL